MVLIEWDTDEKQQQLLEMLKKEGIDNPNNLIVENTVQFSIEKRYPVTRMRFFSTEYDEGTTPTYVFIVEENNDGVSSIYARPPTHKHNRALLEESLAELLVKFEGHLTNHCEMRIRSDTFTRDVLSDLALTAPFILIHCSTAAVFYLTQPQIEFARNLVWPPIEGYQVDSVDLEKDAAKIHENWDRNVSLGATKEILRYLPTTVIRDSSTGEAVSWNTTSPFGQATGQFTLPEFRRSGLARLTEAAHGKTLAMQGLRPFYLTQIQNTTAFEAAKRSPYVTMWEEKIENNNEDVANGKPRERTHLPIQHTIIKRSV